MKHAINLDLPFDVGTDPDGMLTFTIQGDPNAVDVEAVRSAIVEALAEDGELDLDVQVTRHTTGVADFDVRLGGVVVASWREIGPSHTGEPR